MNKLKIIYIYLILTLFISNVLSQNPVFFPNKNSRNRVTTKTVPACSSIMPSPSAGSESIKYKIKVEKDSAFYSLKADLIEKGKVVDEKDVKEGGSYGYIVYKNKVVKGNEIVFEMIPDISKSNVMTLYTYLGGAILCNYLINGYNNKQIKYKKFIVAPQLKNTPIPLILCYIDDEQNNNEKLLNKYLKNDLVYITSYKELQEKILKYIEKCLLVYYNLDDK